MRLLNSPDQLAYWMKLRGFHRNVDFVDAVNERLAASGSTSKLSAAVLSYLLRKREDKPDRSPGDGAVADAIVATLQLGVEDELHLRRLWDGSFMQKSGSADDEAA